MDKWKWDIRGVNPLPVSDSINNRVDRVVSLLTFADSITCIHIHSFLFFLSLSFAQRVCTLTYHTVYRNIYIFICVAGKKECTFMYTYVFSYVFPLKTPRTIGSMLNVSLFICIMYSGFSSSSLFIIYNLGSDTCAGFRLRIILSLYFFLYFVLYISPAV